METTNKISEDLENNHNFFQIIDSFIEENNMELKKLLETEDKYRQFVVEKSQELTRNILELIHTAGLQYSDALEIACVDMKESLS